MDTAGSTIRPLQSTVTSVFFKIKNKKEAENRQNTLDEVQHNVKLKLCGLSKELNIILEEQRSCCR